MPTKPASDGPLSISSSPRDVVFDNHDILVLIFGYFIPPLGDSSPRSELDKSALSECYRQLLDLGLVCQAFSPPALDCLWTNIDGITSLLQLHPGLRVVEGKFYFIGDSDSCSTSRFREYAKRIRGVRFDDTDGAQAPIVSLAGLSCLTQQLKGTPLTPGLQTLCFTSPDCDSVHMGVLPLILSRSVRRVIFGGSFIHADIFRSFALPQLCSMVPNLQNLQFCGGSTVEDGQAGTWEDLPDLLGNLQLDSLKLKFPSNFKIKPTFLAALGKKLEDLTDLTLDCHTLSHGPSTDVMGTMLFPSLKTLHLYNRSEAEICHCYPSFLVSRATRITFCTGDVPDADAFSRTANTLSKVQFLKAIEIKASEIVAYTALIPFLQLLSLEELAVGPNSCFELQTERGGTDIRRLIDAAYPGNWKEGEERKAPLRVLATPVWSSNGYAPLSTLVYIAQKADGLERIALPIDSSIVDNSSTEETATIKSLLHSWNSTHPFGSESTIRHLNIADHRSKQKSFTASEYRDIACLLDTIFPNMESVTPMQHIEGFDSRWDQDWELVEDYRKMRKALRLYRGTHS